MSIRKMKNQSLGDELISAVKETLENKVCGKCVRPKIDTKDVLEYRGMLQQEFAGSTR